MIWWTSHECQKGLDETKTNSDKANNCVWVWANSFRKALKLKYDENKASNCESPGQHHEVSVPYKPLVKIETSFWCPCLLEISVDKVSFSFSEAFWILYSHLAIMIPRLAEQIQAPIINAPWRKMNILDFDLSAPTSPSPWAALDTILSLSCFWMSPVSFTRPLASITWYFSFSKSQMLPSVIDKCVKDCVPNWHLIVNYR